MEPSLPEVHLIAGTRPEAIKLAPVAAAMRTAGLVQPVMIQRTTGEQAELMTEMVRQLDAVFAKLAHRGRGPGRHGG